MPRRRRIGLDKRSKIYYNIKRLHIYTEEEGLLRSIKDNTYVFSIAKSCFGRIIAERSRHVSSAVGKNIFEHLKMRDEEVSFFLSNLSTNGRNVVCAACELKGDRAVLFFGFMARAAAICLAVVPDMSLSRVSRAVVNSDLQENCISNGVVEAARKCKRKEPLAADNEAWVYLSGVFRQIMKAESLRTGEHCEPAEDIRGVAMAIGDFVGVEIGFDYGFDPNELYGSCHDVFEGTACAALMLVLAVSARVYSSNGRLDVLATQGVSGCLLEFSFEKRGDGWMSAVRYLIDAIRARNDLPISLEECEDSVRLSIIPYYEDVGFVGVKERDIYFDPLAYEELFYRYI